MKYLIRKSIVRLVGPIWMPSVVCAQTKELSSYDVGNIKQEAMYRVYGEDYRNPTNPPAEIIRDDVAQWLSANSGDFRDVIDFEASIEDGDKTLDFPWATEDGEYAYLDATSSDDY